MICKHCGADIPEDVTHCPVCGQPVDATAESHRSEEDYFEPETEEEADELAAEESEQPQAAEEDEEYFDETQPAQESKPEPVHKSKYRKWMGWAIAAIVVLALAAAGIFARPQVMKLFLSPKTYYMLLEAKNLNQLEKSLAAQPKTAAVDKLGQYCSISLDSNGIPNLSADTLSALNALQLNYSSESDATSGVSNIACDLSYRTEKLLQVSTHVNGGTVGVQLPQLNDTYYTFATGKATQGEDNAYSYLQGMTGLDPKNINAIVDKYLRQVYLDNIPSKNVSYVSNAQLEGKSCNAIQLTFDSQTLKSMTDDLKSSLKSDTQLKKALMTAYEKNQGLFASLSGLSIDGKVSLPAMKSFEQGYDQWINSISFDQTKYMNQSIRMTIYFDQQEHMIGRQIASYKNETQESNLLYRNLTEGKTRTVSLSVEVQKKSLLDVLYKKSVNKKQVTEALTIASGGISIFGCALNYTADQGEYDGSMSGALRLQGSAIKLSGTFSLKLVDMLTGKMVTGDASLQADTQAENYTIEYSATQGDNPNEIDTSLKFSSDANSGSAASFGFGLNIQYTQKKLSHVDPIAMTVKNSQPISKLFTDKTALQTIEANVFTGLISTKLGDSLGLFGAMQ